MTKPRILFIETHYTDPTQPGVIRTNSVDWWRIINPATALKKHTDWEIDIRKGAIEEEASKTGISNQASLQWDQIGQNYDLIFCGYFDNGLAYAYLHVLKERYNLKFITDLDDNIFDFSPYNPVGQAYLDDPKSYAFLKENIYQTNYLTVTNGKLKDVLREFRKRKKEDEFIRVLPNAIDLEVYKPMEHIEDDIITIAYQGGATHYADLMETPFGVAISYILGKYQGRVKFDVFGFVNNSEFEGIPGFERTVCKPDFYQYVDFLREKAPRWDIGVAPLEEIDFNETKSNIKWMEYAIYGIPAIVTDFGPYKMIQSGKTGLKVLNTKQWIEAFEQLIADQNLRRTIGENAREEVKRNWTIDTHWQHYKDVIEEVLGRS